MSLDDLYAAVWTDLRAIDVHVFPAEPIASDRDRAMALYGAATSVLTRDRGLFLRFATTFLGCAFEARAGGDLAEADRWRRRAEAELDRYREPAPELQPYFIGGAS
jgi:hypothetical protein